MSRSKHIITFLFIVSCTFSIAQNEILVPNRVGNSWGFKAINGTKTIKAVYDSVVHFSHYIDTKKGAKHALVQKGNLWGLIDMQGKTVIPIEYEQLRQVSENNPSYYIAKNKKGKFGLLYKKKFLTAFTYDT
ncbi:MAG: WG repeat-containing protein [Bacteroidota bacterium]